MAPHALTVRLRFNPAFEQRFDPKSPHTSPTPDFNFSRTKTQPAPSQAQMTSRHAQVIMAADPRALRRRLLWR